MPRSWTRGVSINNNTFGYYGWAAMASLAPGDSLLHTFWSFSAWGVFGSLDQFPQGSSICRAGIITVDATLEDVPTPITNEGDAWIDLTTIHPHGQIATSTNVDWAYQWDTGLSDRNSVIHRQNELPTNDLALYMSWEFQVASDASDGFAVGGWNCSVDAYIDTH